MQFFSEVTCLPEGNEASFLRKDGNQQFSTASLLQALPSRCPWAHPRTRQGRPGDPGVPEAQLGPLPAHSRCSVSAGCLPGRAPSSGRDLVLSGTFQAPSPAPVW